WFTEPGPPAAAAPSSPYAASNLGTLLPLLSYPTLIEPRLHLRDASWLSQTALWSLGYLLLAGLIAACAATVRWSASHPPVRSPAVALDGAVITAVAAAPRLAPRPHCAPLP